MIEIVQADLAEPAHARAVLELTRAYAQDPMGDARDLAPEVQTTLVERLRAHPTTHVFLAFDAGHAVGIATCFLGFSTFAGRPLLNLHDLHVLPAHQRRGIARRLLEAVEVRARALGCCKLTLEVLERNDGARKLYDRLGFESGGLFRVKPLDAT